MTRALVGCGLLAAGPGTLMPQDTLPPWSGGFTESLGLPAGTRFYAGATFGLDWRRGRTTAPTEYVSLGISRSFGSPAVPLPIVAAEAYGGLRGSDADGGFRALLQVPILRTTAGVDYNLSDDGLAVLVGHSMSLRRGGIFRGGTLVRWEWSSSPVSALRASVIVPIRQPAAGRTRPLRDRVSIPLRVTQPTPSRGRFRELDDVLERMRLAAEWVQRLVIPPIDRGGLDVRTALDPLLQELRNPPAIAAGAGAGLNVQGFVRAYHEALDQAFSLAASGGPLPGGRPSPEGLRIADSARRVLRQELLYPYNRLLGQSKSKTTLAGLATFARGNFARSVVAGTSLPAEREVALHHVFDRLLTVIQALDRDAQQHWRGNRLVWLPLQLGLRPEDHDTQAELDAIVEAVVGAHFTGGNQIGYVINGEFQTQVIRTILQAEDYHVLWVHDFAGHNGAGAPDTIAAHLVTDAYYEALIRRVRAYDQRARIPTFMIFVDQHYYEMNRGRLWLELLQRPLGKIPRLPPHQAEFSRAIRERQRELQTAIDSSRLLQAETRQYGEKWLQNLIKVHVSITHPGDQSFWSREVVPLLGIPDNIMRDHRKIAFYDITEEDPYRGLAIYTGMGIGEHYVGESWEDRSIMVRGPAVLSLKAQARALLESQGLTGDRLPYVLRPRQGRPGPGDSVRLQGIGRRNQRAVELHNGPGFQDKQISVAKAALFSLMPPGSVILAPDPLWASAFYASLLTGSAFRGCRVLVMAPSLEAAPAANWPSMALAHDVFERLIVLQQELGRELEESGGMLKTGVYNPDVGVDAILDRLALAYTNGRKTPFLRRLLPVHWTVDSMIIKLPAPGASPAGTNVERQPARRVRPKLHLKATFFASREGWDSLVARPELLPLLETYVGQFSDDRADPQVRADTLNAKSEELESSFRASRTPEERERIAYFLLIGSANGDYRSMVFDGEASVLLSGWSGVVSLIDFVLITSLSVWIDDLETLDALIPAPSGFQRGFARWIRYVL